MKDSILPSTPEQTAHIHDRLRAYNSAFMQPTGEFCFHIERDGRIVAGIVAEGICDTLEIVHLFVEAPFRGQGLGSALLQRVEEAAKEKGISRVFLNTYSFQAPGFYKKQGYSPLFDLSPCFAEHTQHFFIKQLT